MPHFGGSLSSVAPTVQKLWPKIGLGRVPRSQNLGQNWPIAAKILIFDKIDILAAKGQFWPKFWLRGTRPRLILAITITHQNLAFFMLFHFVPNSFPIKSILFKINPKMSLWPKSGRHFGFLACC